MIVDAHELENGSTLETDLCIVGAGAAGISIAREFAQSSLRVCLLESGGLEFESSIQSLYKGSNVGREYFPLESARLRYFGGSTNHWANLCRPLDRQDFQKRSWVPYSGWPISKEDLDPYYERAQRLCGLGPYEYESEYWSELSGYEPLALHDAKVITRVWQTSFPITRFGEAYREEIESSKAVTVYLHGTALELETDEFGGHVQRLHAATLEGPRFVVESKAFVLATGGIENARLLLLSNRLWKSGLGNDNDMVGRFFMEHPHVQAGYLLPSAALVTGADLYRHRSIAGSEVMGVLTLSAELQEQLELLNLGVELKPTSPPSMGLYSAKRLYRDVKRGELPDDLMTHLGNVIGDLDAVVDEVYKRAFDSPKGVFNYPQPFGETQLKARAESAPNPESRVSLSAQRDAFGQNQVQLNWQLSSIDKLSLRKSLEAIAMEVGRSGLGRLRIDLDNTPDGWPRNLRGGWHHMGTTRMSSDPKAGVVDGDCKLHGVANVYVAGSSVFPTSGWANPTLTIVALALRLADHLQQVST